MNLATTREHSVKYVSRRGKELIKHAFIATGNEENEYGKAMVPRDSPFRSSSMDVLQSTLRCNADYQYQKRAVPDLQGTELEPSATEQSQHRLLQSKGMQHAQHALLSCSPECARMPLGTMCSPHHR